MQPDPLTILNGDALTMLCTLESESVQTCVTSPPYWGLRDYGTATWADGDVDCDHVSRPQVSEKSASNQGALRDNPYKSECGKCGAMRIDSQSGLEKTPEAYVAALVDVFREVRRALRTDGTVWLNIGDSYANQGVKDVTRVGGFTGRRHRARAGMEDFQRIGREGAGGFQDARPKTIPVGLKPKDLVGIPWRVAFALQSDGWWLRSDIIWSKPNPMPESVTDRPTKAHEYLFLLAKSEKYYYDALAIAEPVVTYDSNKRDRETTKLNNTPGRTRMGGLVTNDYETRNKRTVWVVPTAPYPDAHFATYPPELITPCILAGSRIGDTVLDPFAGSFTTCKVAIELGRKAIGIELNPAYIELGKRRCQTTMGLPFNPPEQEMEMQTVGERGLFP